MRAPLAIVVALSAAPAQAYEGVANKTHGESDIPGTGVVTQMPELLEFVEAAFPPDALSEGRAGSVGMVVEIAADGTVTGAQVVQSAGEAFDQAALAAVRAFKFRPAEIDHLPAQVAVPYTYHFVLKPPEPPPPPPPEAPPPELPISLRGKILERGTRNPLSSAIVRSIDPADETMSAQDGSFELRLPPGKRKLLVVVAGHERFETEEEVREGEVQEVTYYVRALAYGLYETVVTGEREKKEVVRRTLQREELARMPGSFGDPVRAILNLPGLARTPFVGGLLIVRGAEPRDSGVYLDGHRIPLLYHFLGGPSVIAADMIDRIDFFPGGYTARYGRSIGGAVDIAVRKGARDRARGNADLDLMDAGFFAESPLGKEGAVALGARRSYVDVLLPFVTPEPDEGILSVAPRYWDYQLRGDYLRTGAHRLSLMLFGSDDRLTLIRTGDQTERDITLSTSTTFHRLVATWQWTSGAWSVVASPALGYNGATLDLNAISVDSDQLHAELRAEAVWKPREWFALTLGMDHDWREANYLALVPKLPDYRMFPGGQVEEDLVTYDRDIRGAGLGGYVEADLTVGPLQLVPGLRLDHFILGEHERGGWDPRLTLRWRLGHDWALKASAGHYKQSPQPEQLDPDFGQPKLKLEKAVQTSAGFEWRISGPISLDVVGFFNRRYDLVQGSTQLDFVDGTVIPQRFNNRGSGRAYGAEVLLRHDITQRVFGWLAYTLAWSEQKNRFGEYVFTSLDQRHTLTLVGSYTLDNGWTAGARFRLVTGRPDTPVVGAIFDADTGGFRRLNGDPQSERLPTFHQLDFRVDKAWAFEKWMLTLYLDVQNVYNAVNQEAVSWDYRFRQATPIPGLPILPTLGVKGEF